MSLPGAAAAHYRGRFAPSPTGPLHAGSLVAALGSWLDARAHGGVWLVRIEDVDRPRCVAGAAETLLGQLAACGLTSDEAVVWQSARSAHYEGALQRLREAGWAYPCGCSRQDIDAALLAQGIRHRRDAERVYPGTCRTGLHGKPARAWRLRCASALHDAAPLCIDWHDRRLGAQTQDLTHAVGDFVLRRGDGLYAYQLAVVVDDAEQAVSDVVRGEDLADNTPRQIHLQRCLGLPTPRYLHLPLLLGADGRKLSKQSGAAPLELREPLAALRAAAATLGLAHIEARSVGDWLVGAVAAWRARWMA